jgi:hypothetical protein
VVLVVVHGSVSTEMEFCKVSRALQDAISTVGTLFAQLAGLAAAGAAI